MKWTSKQCVAGLILVNCLFLCVIGLMTYFFLFHSENQGIAFVRLYLLLTIKRFGWFEVTDDKLNNKESIDWGQWSECDREIGLKKRQQKLCGEEFSCEPQFARCKAHKGRGVIKPLLCCSLGMSTFGSLS